MRSALSCFIPCLAITAVFGMQRPSVQAEESKVSSPAAAQLPKSQFPEGSPPFLTDLAKAQEEAKASGKPIFAVFSAIWCGPCHFLKDEVFPSAELKPFHDQFIWVYLDIDIPENDAAVAKYKVNTLPHLQFISASGEPLTSTMGAPEAKDLATILTIVQNEQPSKTAPAEVKK